MGKKHFGACGSFRVDHAGGESTTIDTVDEKYELWDALREAIASGLPVYATCAGIDTFSA